eukprot:TRINITY_DN5422_c0_g1_i1.p1 TRINITY_DN5422_c0_g1~~TRINITY_DN5422_c0_g1_i1.p1  ORF type:complete len:350 (-),score=97.07 TRINITY_DN5422_c0_g1_i1:183-1232(-)
MSSSSKVEAFSIVGLGNPLLDISVQGTNELLKKYNLKNNNQILADKSHLPLYEELSNMKNVEYIAGGACQNTIRVAQWMTQTKGASAYIGCVGKDKFGKKLKEVGEADGVKMLYMEDEKEPSGTCACIIVDNDRSLCANVAAAAQFKPSFLETKEVQAVLAKAKLFYVEGYFFTSSHESVMYLAKYAHKNNKIFALNLSATFLPLYNMKKILEAMPYVDFLFGNDQEAKAFAETEKLTDLSSMTVIASKIASYPKENSKRPRVVVITQGSKDCIVATGSEVQAVAIAPMDKKEIVDTNGAGDAFCGGFLAKYVEGRDLKTCVLAGDYSAKVILRVSGCSLPKTAPTFKL